MTFDLSGFLGDFNWDRHPLVRTGERQPIDPGVRLAVLLRDNFRCDWCGVGGVLELDHIIPWSAGGTDETTNLRLLCPDHNAQRSNFHDPARPRRLPCTFACDWCGGEESTDDAVRCYCASCQRFSVCSTRESLL